MSNKDYYITGLGVRSFVVDDATPASRCIFFICPQLFKNLSEEIDKMNNEIAIHVLGFALDQMTGRESNLFKGGMLALEMQNDNQIDEMIARYENVMIQGRNKNRHEFQENLWMIKVLHEWKNGLYSMLEEYVLHDYKPSLTKTNNEQLVERVTSEIINRIRGDIELHK